MSYRAEVGLVSVRTSDSKRVRPPPPPLPSRPPGCAPGLGGGGFAFESSSCVVFPLTLPRAPCSESSLQHGAVTLKPRIDRAVAPARTCVPPPPPPPTAGLGRGLKAAFKSAQTQNTLPTTEFWPPNSLVTLPVAIQYG